MSHNEVEGGGVPAGSKNSWGSFLKSIASFNGDLSSLTAPPFILSSQSIVEYSAYWTENQSLFLAATKESDPTKRMLCVTRWLLNTYHQQYCSRSEQFGNEKKPLNPFLGELFLGHWDDTTGGQTTLVSEQVCHHPPVTAYCINNPTHNIQLQGYNGQKATFSRTIHIKQIGHSLLTLTPPGSSTPETYLITLPALHVESLIYGTPFVEAEKSTHIVSSSGLVSKLDYSGKGWLSGKKNSFTAAIWELQGKSTEKHPLYTLDGQWNDTFHIYTSSSKTPLESVPSKNVPLQKLQTLPLDQQDMFESRRAWHNVAVAIEKGDNDATSHFKSRIEQAQRALRKKEEQEKRDWRRIYFSQADQNSDLERTFAKLVKVTEKLGWEGVEANKTGGVWRYDSAKAQNAKRPFHADCQYEALGETQGGSATVASGNGGGNVRQTMERQNSLD